MPIELLSIVVAPKARGGAIATKLVKAGLEECYKRKIDKLKVLVGIDNKPANKLYEKCGFELVQQIKSHGTLSNIYVIETE